MLSLVMFFLHGNVSGIYDIMFAVERTGGKIKRNKYPKTLVLGFPKNNIFPPHRHGMPSI